MKHTTLLSLASLALAPSALAQDSDVALPHRFAAGTPARASEVNENFDRLAEEATEGAGRLDAVETEQTSLGERLTGAEDALDALGTSVDANTASAAANASAGADNAAALAELEARLRPANTVLVAREDGDFASVVEALASLDAPSPENPFVVLVAPGRYTESEAVRVQAGVHLRGFGPDTSVIAVERSATFPSEAAAAVRLFDGGRISNLGIVNEGASLTSIGIVGFELSTATIVDGVHARVEGDGGSGHFAVHTTDSDLVVRDSLLVASGASIVNTAFGSIDTGGPFAQPRIEGSELRGLGATTGIGLQLSSTAATVTDSLVRGESEGVAAMVAGISRIHHSRVETLGFNPVYTNTGSATVLSAGVGFVGGNTEGLTTSFRFVHCYGPAFQPIDDGDGSTIQ